ncbi:hypothetical protein O181_054925 [Austropuccinia psidii MF-1]|uniref:Uncharacterized protein n=1 Tax=Austropuccinia psidii MF-1 TaxID=1389203 RepID=A0A9Q3E9R0_9BASI|nr:hypothetical protein [Austropuccinia psidii MF-1]
MSSSNPHKSHSGSLHDSDSESSIEYVQTTQSPISPNIPLKTPIASSMNVSGFNTDVGNVTSQASSTWSIPDISVIKVTPNPTHTKMHMSKGPGRTTEVSSKVNPQAFLLNPGLNPVASQEPFGESEQPSLKIPTGSQLHVGHEKQVDADEISASSPLVHKEKATGNHHPYASKPRMGHASSSREKIVDDEDENMSLTQSENNDEPRGDYFTAHEQDTQSNSEFTHPQMPLSQIMLDKSKMRQQRKKPCKAQNVVKRASQKEQQG